MSAPEEIRRAFVVAVSDYADDRLRELRSPASDAEALERVLADPDIGGYEVETSLEEDEGTITRKLDRFLTGDVGRSHRLLLHLSCHGLKDAGGELFFAARDTNLDHLLSTAIPSSLLARLMRASRAGQIVLFLDCCYSGAFERGLASRAGDAVDVVERFQTAGRAIITASSATEYAFENGELRDRSKGAAAPPSLFTSAVVRGLRHGDADLDRDGRVSLDELYDYVLDEVRRQTAHQTPSMSIPQVSGRIYIARSPHVAARRETALPVELLEAVTHPLAGVRRGAVDELVRLLHGRVAELAAEARRWLEELADDDSRLVRDAARTALDGTKPRPPPVERPVRPAVLVGAALCTALLTLGVVYPWDDHSPVAHSWLHPQFGVLSDSTADLYTALSPTVLVALAAAAALLLALGRTGARRRRELAAGVLLGCGLAATGKYVGVLTGILTPPGGKGIRADSVVVFLAVSAAAIVLAALGVLLARAAGPASVEVDARGTVARAVLVAAALVVLAACLVPFNGGGGNPAHARAVVPDERTKALDPILVAVAVLGVALALRRLPRALAGGALLALSLEAVTLWIRYVGIPLVHPDPTVSLAAGGLLGVAGAAAVVVVSVRMAVPAGTATADERRPSLGTPG